MQNVGAAWLMVSLGAGPAYVALTQTAASLPYFLLALPAGSAGDIVDRRKLVLFTESWMMGVALLLVVLTIAGFMSPWLLLVLTFALSAGDAFETPTWRALLPELVSKDDLASASALNGIEFNLARAVGPALAGVVIAAAGVAAAFAVNCRLVPRRHCGGCEVEEADSQADRAARNIWRRHGCGYPLCPPLTRNPHRSSAHWRSHVLLRRAFRLAADSRADRK